MQKKKQNSMYMYLYKRRMTSFKVFFPSEIKKNDFNIFFKSFPLQIKGENTENNWTAGVEKGFIFHIKK